MNRGAPWEDREVRALIAVWGESNVQEQLDGVTRNKVVYEQISREHKKQGIEQEWKQCRDKIKNLKTQYKDIKDNNETGRGRKTCKFYSLLDSILGHRPATEPPCLLDTGDSSQPFRS